MRLAIILGWVIVVVLLVRRAVRVRREELAPRKDYNEDADAFAPLHPANRLTMTSRQVP